MADNFSDINENFDTIKTLLNSIRAQGILNTSDVDKLLEGINSKLAKINTEEDIDLIKAFLSELKKNLDERHEVLISKFGAIESLFSNLLKNSNDAVKSNQLKELFDIVATNLSVFSREVVEQKERLQDITLRLDAMRSDESQKKDIIKSVSTVRNDIEKLNNGFDSIVISLNENFKTVLKTISEIDQSDAIKSFTEQLTDLLNSSNTILTAIQLVDKKNNQIEQSFEGLATHDDTASIQHSLVDLTAKSQEMVNLVDSLTQKSYKIDNLSEKIDATVDILVGLKTDIAEKEDSVKNDIIESLTELAEIVKNASVSDTDPNFVEEIKERLVLEYDKISQLLDVNVTRTLNDISSNAEVLNNRLKDSHSSITELCEKSFSEVSLGIADLRTVVAQLDENNVSANNAIFSNITDRLAIFESSLKMSLEKQEDYVSGSSTNVIEQISNIKNIADGIEYKLDSNAIELGNTKREFSALSESVNKILGLDFVNVVKDFKLELYASKQDLVSAIETAQNDISEKSTGDLFGKYELLVSKLDSVEDEIKFVQTEAMNSLNSTLTNISSSIVDILSYVSNIKDANNEVIESKLSEVTTFLQDSNLNYIENVRDVVDVIRLQVESNLKQMSEDSDGRFGKLKNEIALGNESVRQDIKTSYDKLLEVQGSIASLNDLYNANNINLYENVNNILSSTELLKDDFEGKMESLKLSLLDIVSEFKKDFTCDNADKISELKFNAENLHSISLKQSVDLKNELKSEIDGTIEALRNNIASLNELVSSSSLKIEGANREIIDFVRNDFTSEVNNSVDTIKTNTAEVLSEIDNKVIDVVNGFNTLETSVNNLSKETTSSLSATLAKILENFVALNSSMVNLDEQSAERMKESADELKSEFDLLKKKMIEVDSAVDEDLARQISIIEGNFESLNLMLVDIMNQATDSLGEKIKKELSCAANQMSSALADELEQYKTQIGDLFEGLQGKNNEQAEYIKGCASELNNVLEATLTLQNKDYILQLEEVGNHLKEMLHDNIELTSADYESLKAKLNDFIERIERHNNVLVETIRAQLDDIIKFVDSNLDIQSQEVSSTFEEIDSSIQKAVSTIRDLNNEWSPKLTDIKTALENVQHQTQLLFDDNMTSLVAQIGNSNEKLSEEILEKVSSFNAEILLLNEKIDKEGSSILETQQNKIQELNVKFNEIVNNLKEYTRTELTSVSETLKIICRESDENFEQDINTKFEAIQAQIETVRQNSNVCKDVISKLVAQHSDIIAKNIEKETDIIIGEIIEQFDSIKDTQKDEFTAFASSIGGTVSGYIIDAINDLKSYMDVKSDSTVMDAKIDALRSELGKSVESTSAVINKMLEASVFNNALSDLRTANEVLVTTMADNLNSKFQEFINQNVSKKIDEKTAFLDKKFIDTVVDKYEEVKILSTEYNKSFERIADSVSELVTKFVDSKNEINGNLKSLLSGIGQSVDELKSSFADLKAQILNKSFDEAFHTSVHNQISGIENLVQEQIGYIEDISELCCTNLPEIAEMNTIVKHGIQHSLSELKERLENQGLNIDNELRDLKSDIITQFINIFNQISFVAEQEEIIDFIQEKHSELITILSHIVTTVDDVENVKDNLAVVDNKIDTLKEDIDLINEKITAIMSSEGNIDYVYSLQDLESDIANLRIVLNEMKADNKSKEFEELISSTNNIYQIVEAIKDEIPKFETEEFKRDFNNLAEDIVSISTRTNKLILTSDESYKTLQDNLQDFKLVIDDLDERTRNFAHEAGIDKLDQKLGAINTMIQNGAKTNQVFNQVFEYLAEWVDKAGVQISSISDKVETLDDIGQIKVMLEDLRAEAHDTSESEELVSALENIFEKQAKRIATLEAKLDKIIVSSSVSKKSKTDIKPIEDTLNKFLTVIESKMVTQQDKINSLETKLEEVVSLVDNKDTAQLTKKVGGMDKQLAKLNKSIEKIASNVVEK